MKLRNGLFLITLLTLKAQAQQTTVYTEANASYLRGVEKYREQLFGLARKDFKDAMDMLRPVNEPEWKSIKTEAELYYAKCAVKLNLPEAEKLVLDFLREQAPAPVASQAAQEIGEYYFDHKNFEKAISYFKLVPEGSGPSKETVMFKLGYAYFITKKFGPAKNAFSTLKENMRSQWYHPANYYYGCCSFFEGRYDEAQKAFARCELADQYRQSVPYYLVMIYAAKKQYDQVITYGEPKCKDASLKNRPEINQLVGQAFFEKGEITKATPYLTYAAANGAPMRPADYYQLGYAQYQQGDFIHAVNSFKEATSQDSVLSQNSFYHLGASLLKINNKPEAREAFKRASAMKGDPALRDDATVQYAKLSYELKKDREAINALQRIKSDSKNYSEAQNLLAALFMHTRDYQRAVDALEEISPRSAKLNEAYQSVTYHRALQLLNSGNKTGATAYLQKSLKHNTDKNIAAQCHFWLGSIAQDNNKFDESKKSLNTFITAAKTLRDLPDESNLAMGHYLQGYNLLKQEDFSGATANFKSALDLLKGANPAIRNANTRATILSDVQIRLGDCNFKSKNYDAAISAYEEVIRKKYDDADYAMLNLSVIYGLQDQREEKVTELNNFLNKFPKSKYVDEALLEQGKTFQEMGKFREMQVPLKRLVGQLNRSALVPEAYVLLGQSCFELNDLDAAISFYKKVFEFQPESKDRISACNGLREIYIDQKADAEGYLSLANSLKCGGEDISNDDLTFQTAQRQADQGKFTQAIDGFNNYIRKFPDGNNLLPAYNGRANAYVQIKNYSLALKDYQSIVRLGNSNYYLPAAKNGAYLAFNELKDPGTAVEMAAIWEESSRDEKDKLNARLLALEAAFLSGNAAKVYTLSQKIASSTSADGNQKNRAKYLQGISAFRNNDYPIALPALLQVSESDDEEKAAEAWACILQIYLKQNRFEDMETAFDTANDRTDGYPDFQASVFLSMAEMNFARKNTDEAQTILEIVEDSYQGDNQDVNKRIKDLKNKLKTNPGSKNKNSDSLLDMDDRNN